MANIYDVNFNIYNSIAIEADSREEAEEKFYELKNEDIIERAIEGLMEGGLDVGTIELVEGEEDEEDEEE